MTPPKRDPDRYAVIGYPVKHSFSPFIHGMFAKQTKQNLTYRLFEVSPEKLEDEVLNFFVDHGRGMNVTIPHKQAVAPLCQFRTPRAEIAGAVNTLVVQQGGDLLGDNTDGAGLVTDLTKNLGIKLHDLRILLLGAGGAARGALGPLLEQAPALLHIVNRDASKAETLASEFSMLGTVKGGGYETTESTPYDLIINATAASLQGAVPPLDRSALGVHSLCYDMAYGKEDTAFVRWAQEQGARAELGWGMLVEQAAESFQLWRGVRPDTAPVLAAVRSPVPVLTKT